MDFFIYVIFNIEPKKEINFSPFILIFSVAGYRIRFGIQTSINKQMKQPSK